MPTSDGTMIGPVVKSGVRPVQDLTDPIDQLAAWRYDLSPKLAGKLFVDEAIRDSFQHGVDSTHQRHYLVWAFAQRPRAKQLAIIDAYQNQTRANSDDLGDIERDFRRLKRRGYEVFSYFRDQGEQSDARSLTAKYVPLSGAHHSLFNSLAVERGVSVDTVINAAIDHELGDPVKKFFEYERSF